MKNQISNEQCAMSNCCARKRNGKFLLLIAGCALLITGGAQGAKMCLKLSYASDSFNGDGFAIGINCGDSWTLPNWRTACENTMALGFGASGGACTYGATYSAPASGTGYTFCRQTAPNDSVRWVCVGPYQGNASANWCGEHLKQNAVALKAFMGW
ncbi:MAG: hypothetical protein LBL46_00535 [Rickettsiales bacterium]|jgi:hypothetical protein|nr:hypothetical protein [Rickettsiales bacterium]